MNPYQQVPEKGYWRTAIADRAVFDIGDLWQPKFQLQAQDPVATYGSCFAQHIGRALAAREHTWLITEPLPAPALCPPELAKEFNYGIFSARTGNIYTTSLLRQWTQWALDPAGTPDEVWEQGGNFIDPFRPQIEPGGFRSQADLMKSRLQAVACFKRSIEQARYFVFTMGLTESWFNAQHGYEYPMCPGTIAGQYSADLHRFCNQTAAQVAEGLRGAVDNMRRINPAIKLILTVSPVPLTATASGQHVLVATTYSKSVLRTVAGEVAASDSDIDYFPSYEIITGTPFEGIFFERNKRSVHPRGVDFVMDNFFGAMQAKAPARPPARPPAKRRPTRPARTSNSEVCEELLLDAFAPQGPAA